MNLQKRKIGIIGAGHVGSHAGYSLISQGLAEEIVYIDVDEKKAAAQALDLSDAVKYLPSRAKVHAGDYTEIADAQLLITAAGPLPDISKGQTRMDTLRQTIVIMKEVTESIRMSGFAGIIINISNPADVITHYIQHQLNWPPRRILSTGTTLDSARLCRALAEATGVWIRNPSMPTRWENTERAKWSRGPPLHLAGKPWLSFKRKGRTAMACSIWMPSQGKEKRAAGRSSGARAPQNLASPHP